MSTDHRIDQIDRLIQQGLLIINKCPKDGFDKGRVPETAFNVWIADCAQFLIDNLDKRNVYATMFFDSVAKENNPETIFPHAFHVNLGVGYLDALKKYLLANPEYSILKRTDSIEQIGIICNNFHLVSRQLRARRENRSTLDVQDEYDVQDLFHSLLWLFFTDIRPEEWTPSYAGGSSRVDFLLKNEKIAIEIKKTRTSKDAEDNRIGEELLKDIDRYKVHPDCRTLVCFVYDPDGKVSNPDGITADLLKKNTSELKVHVFIRPTGR